MAKCFADYGVNAWKQAMFKMEKLCQIFLKSELPSLRYLFIRTSGYNVIPNSFSLTKAFFGILRMIIFLKK